MDELREYHTNWNKPDRGRQILYDVTYMWHLKNNTDESIYKTETDSWIWKTNLWLPNYKERGAGINSEYWINRYKLTDIK